MDIVHYLSLTFTQNKKFKVNGKDKFVLRFALELDGRF